MGLVLGLASAAAARGAIVCVDPGAASCATTIQQGVDAAAPGDIIEIAPGLYREAVAVATPSVTLRGAKGVFIDPSGLPQPSDAITVSAADVTLEGFAIRNGQYNGIRGIDAARLRILRIDLQSSDRSCITLLGATPGAWIEGNRIRACQDYALFVSDGDGLALIGNSVEGSDLGTWIFGDGVRAERNSFERVSGTCIQIDGDQAIATRNLLHLCQDSITVKGSRAVVARNTLSNTNGRGIGAIGVAPIVEKNTITTSSEAGIYADCEVLCEGGRIVGNRLRYTTGDAGIVLRAGSPGFVVEGNQITQSRRNGIQVDGSGARIEHNRVTGAGFAQSRCAQILGDSNRFRSNQLAGCSGDGLFVSGDYNQIEANRVADTGDDGIDVEGSANELRGNRAEGASDNGIQLPPVASTTVVSGNQARGLRAAYCDGGVGTTGLDVPDSTVGCGNIDD